MEGSVELVKEGLHLLLAKLNWRLYWKIYNGKASVLASLVVAFSRLRLYHPGVRKNCTFWVEEVFVGL